LRYHEQADLFVCIPGTLDPGNENAFPSKLLDYLASGKLVVATPLAHIAEEYGTFLRLLDDETPEGLVKVISELAQLPPQERTRRGQRGREFVMRAKRWNSQGRKLVGLIQSLV
jgi:glycosyltransferase involved in cell wall biosynthesis